MAHWALGEAQAIIGAPISQQVPIALSINQKPFLTLTMQQEKPAKSGEGDEESLRLSWDDAQSYMEDHGISGDKGCFVDKAQEECVANL
eukprot:10165764-Karenia_brevis.AAC.1